MIKLDLNKTLDVFTVKCPETIELQRLIEAPKDGIFGLYTEKQLKLIINKSKTTLSYMREWGFEVRDEISESEVWWLNTITDRQEHEKRKAAMEWWNSLASLRKTQLCDTNTEIVGHVRRHETLTGSEIEKIYKNTVIMKKIENLKVGDYIAFGFHYNGGEPNEIMVSNITSISDYGILVHFMYGHHSLAEYVKKENIIAIGNPEGKSKIHGWNGSFDVVNKKHKLIKEVTNI